MTLTLADDQPRRAQRGVRPGSIPVRAHERREAHTRSDVRERGEAGEVKDRGRQVHEPHRLVHPEGTVSATAGPVDQEGDVHQLLVHGVGVVEGAALVELLPVVGGHRDHQGAGALRELLEHHSDVGVHGADLGVVELPEPVDLLGREPVAAWDLAVADPVRVEPVPDPRASRRLCARTAKGLDVAALVGAVGLKEVHVKEDWLIPGFLQPADHSLGTRVHLQVLVAAGQPEGLPEPGVVQEPRGGVTLGAQVFGEGGNVAGEHRRAAHRPVDGRVEAGEHGGHRRVSVRGGSGGVGEEDPQGRELVEVGRRAPGLVIGLGELVEAHGVEARGIQGQQNNVWRLRGERVGRRLEGRELAPHGAMVRRSHSGERGETEAGHRRSARDTASAGEPGGEAGHGGG